MRVLRGCKMPVSLDKYGGMSRVLLGFLLLASCVPLVRTRDYLSLDATASELTIADRLVSTPNPNFEFGIFPNELLGVSTPSYYLSIRYASPIDQAVTWMSNRSTPLSSAAVLLFHLNGTLELSDQNQNTKRDNIWNTFTDNMDVVSAQLHDTGKLVLKNRNGTEVWNSFDNSSPTDTLLPGQGMLRSKDHSLNSWQRTGDPAIANDTYSFGWDARGVLTLSWTCPKVFLNWKGGSYIPAPDVYAAHTIQNVDKVYFHETLGHLYIGSNPPTAILSGGPDSVNVTTLKRITMYPDGGLRILQYVINQTVTLNQTSNQTSNQSWKVVANWVVSDRPDSRSQCTTFGTCGPYSECVSPIDSLELVTCRCPGTNNIATKDWFTPIDVNNTAKGCQPPSQRADCPNENGTYSSAINPVGMLELPGVDMPWGGDYRNLTGNASVNCKEECMKDCYCAGAVYSNDEQMCWLGNGILFNLGYPTVALHGTNRTSYLRNQTVLELLQPPAAKKDNKWVKILVPAVGIPGVLLIGVVIFCLCRNEKVRKWIPDRGSCCRRSIYEIKFPDEHETPVKNEQGDGAQN